MLKYPHLFSPIKINRTFIKNRIIAAPTSDDFEEKALGGAGVVIAGHAIVEPGFSSFASADEPYIFQKYQYEETRRRILKIQRAGAKASIELFHGGQDARVKTFAKGPCTLKRKDGTQVIGMDEAMMEETLGWYAKTAREARDLGFDEIFLHFGHGWLPAQFLSPIFNHRTDEYGGSLENRMRFPIRILKAVREAVGPNFPVEMRISAIEWAKNSIEFSDVLTFIKTVEPLIDIVHISAGMDMDRQSNVHCMTTNFAPLMPNVDYAAQVKKAVNIPVSVVSAVLTPAQGEEIIASGKADMVAYGRAFIADPYWPKKVLEGKEWDVNPCVRCMQCYHIATNHKNVGCTVNPRFNHTTFVPKDVPLAKTKKKVVIIGGGPGGMKAAITASIAGHDVTLIEKNDVLGGQLIYVAQEFYKVEIKRLLGQLRAQVAHSNAKVLLNTEATPEMVAAMNPDAIIIAVGGYEAQPPIPGLKDVPHMSGTEAIEHDFSKEDNIAILGGGTIGAEIGLELSEKEHKHVTVVEMGDKVAAQGNMLYKIALQQKIDACDTLDIKLNTACQTIDGNTMTVKDSEGEHTLKFDHLVVSTGVRPKDSLAESFYGIAPETNMIGDCVRPRKIMDAIFEGHTVAMSL